MREEMTPLGKDALAELDQFIKAHEEHIMCGWMEWLDDTVCYVRTLDANVRQARRLAEELLDLADDLMRDTVVRDDHPCPNGLPWEEDDV